MVASAAALVQRQGGKIRVSIADVASTPYFVRMGLYEQLGVLPPRTVTEHEAAGRFIPLTQLRTQEELDNFVVNIPPLLHGAPEESEAVKQVQYVITELVRNALEHSYSPVGAFACAQYYPQTRRVGLGISDGGIGIRASMARSHPVPTDLDSIQLALRPGITGTTARIGGTEENAGAGLFFTKAIARASRNFFVIYSGQALYKLLRGSTMRKPTIQEDPTADPSRLLSGLPTWSGTAVGIDISLRAGATFNELIGQIRDVYASSERAARRDQFRKPRFR